MSHPLVIITGASSGIGASLAVALGETKQFRLALLARREEQLTAVADKTNLPADQVLVIPTDVTKRDAWKRAVEEVLNKWGRIDILVNNAGAILLKSFLDVTDEEVNEMMQVNVFSALYGIQEVLPHMKLLQRGGSGQIINVSSIVGRNAEEGYVAGAYAAAKHYLIALTCALRAEHRESFPNIKFQTVLPGPVATEMALQAMKGKEEHFKEFLNSMQSVEDCARVILEQAVRGKQEEVYTREGDASAQLKYLRATILGGTTAGAAP